MTVASLTRSHGYVRGIGGLRLHYRAWEVPDARAALLVVHGFAEHGGRYSRFAEWLAGSGISCFALDLRGHGASEGRRGHCPRFGCFLQDLDRFRREVQSLVGSDCPIVLLGHSLGGLIGLRYLEEYDAPLLGAILSAPWLGTPFSTERWRVTLADALARVLPTLPFSAGVHAEHLSHDPRVVASYRDDPVVHDTITPRFFQEVRSAMDRAVECREQLLLPLLFLIPGDDRLVDSDRSRWLARALAERDVTLKVYPGYFHEVLNEKDPEPVFRDLRDWLTAHLA